jgi:hypothetical protein
MDDLAARHFALLEHRGDVGVADVEHVVEEKRGPLIWCEALEQGQEGDRQIAGEVEIVVRRRGGHDRLRQPWPHVRFALGPEPPQPIDCQPARGRYQPCFRRFDNSGADIVPANIRFLDDVFGVRA